MFSSTNVGIICYILWGIYFKEGVKLKMKNIYRFNVYLASIFTILTLISNFYFIVFQIVI